MKSIEVVAAIIAQKNKIFATQRGYGKWKGKWEFPGGKIELGETKEEALKREIREELDTEIKINALMQTVEYNYPEFHLILHCFLCEVVQGNLVLLEHQDAKWLTASELDTIDWLPADLPIIKRLKEEL